MDKQLKDRLKYWERQYNTKHFIPADPVSFPHRFTEKRDIEISGLLTSWIAYGNRKQILKKAEEIHTDMAGQPYTFITNRTYAKYEANGDCTFYRFFKYADLYAICERLHQIYTLHTDMEAAVTATGKDPLTAMQTLFEGINGIPYTPQSACKRLAMFLRWMVRRDEIVDFGIWTHLSPSSLLIPLDTHVFNMARRLGMTSRRQADRKTAEEITTCLREIWPDDPCKGDFALFGYGVSERDGAEAAE